LADPDFGTDHHGGKSPVDHHPSRNFAMVTYTDYAAQTQFIEANGIRAGDVDGTA
jgi:hypothetical protein